MRWKWNWESLNLSHHYTVLFPRNAVLFAGVDNFTLENEKNFLNMSKKSSRLSTWLCDKGISCVSARHNIPVTSIAERNSKNTTTWLFELKI